MVTFDHPSYFTDFTFLMNHGKWINVTFAPNLSLWVYGVIGLIIILYGVIACRYYSLTH